VNGRAKSLLIEALDDVLVETLPEDVRTQRKRTFTFPWDNWLRGALRKRVSEALADWSPVLEPHLAKSFANGVWDDFLNGRTSWSRPWSLYVLNEWVKLHLSASDAGISLAAGSSRLTAARIPQAAGH
jgi:hypothetical protein